MDRQSKLLLSKSKLLIAWSVLLLILSSGHLYFTILNIRLTLIIMAGTAALLVLKFGVFISKKNFYVFIAVLFCVFFNYAVNLQKGILINDVILLLIRIIFIIILQGIITVELFKKYYINIMTIEAMISLICFILVNVLNITQLPLEFTAIGDMNGYYLTLYYTIGWFNYPVFNRNAGFFWEPGAHQIFLNLAILFLINNILKYKSDKKIKDILKLIILISTVLTTQSTTGYMCLAVVLVSALFGKGEKEVSNKLKLIIAISLVVFIVIENRYGIISYKLEGGGSYETRMTETLTGLKLANENWLFGMGLLRENRAYVGANGLFSLIVSLGYPMVCVYLFAVFYGLKRFFNRDIGITLFAFVFYVMSLSSEAIAPMTLFLSFLFCWKFEDKKGHNSNLERLYE